MLFFSLWILLSAFFMRHLLQFILEKTNMHVVSMTITVLFLISGVMLLKDFSGGLFSRRQTALFVLLILAGYFFAWRMKYVVEKIHFLKYGFLGWLVARDEKNGGRGGLRSLCSAVLFSFFIVCCDESIQWFLPDRVGDIRDIGFGVAGGFWGGALFSISSVKRLSVRK